MSLGIASDNVRIWLESKLENPWNGANVAYLLTKDVLALIVDQWGTLDTTLKLRLLSALMSAKSAQLRNMQDEIQRLVASTADDGDGWVQSMGQIVSTALRPENPEFNLAALRSHLLTAPVVQKLQEQRTSSHQGLKTGSKILPLFKVYSTPPYCSTSLFNTFSFSISLVKTISVSDYGPIEEAYLQRPNYTPKPNPHFTVAKPAARRTVSRDLLSSSTNARGQLTSSKPGLAGLQNRPTGSLLSSSGSVGSRPLGASSYGIGGASKPSSVLGQGSARPEGARRFLPVVTAPADDIISMVDPIAMAMQEQQKKDEEKKKKEDAKAARLAKKAAAEARKEGKEEDAGVAQLGKLSQTFDANKPAKKKPKLKEGETPATPNPPTAAKSTSAAAINLTSSGAAGSSSSSTPATAATAAASSSGASAAPANPGSLFQFAEALIAASEDMGPGANDPNKKPTMPAGVQPPSLTSAGGHLQLGPMVTSGSHLPIYGNIHSAPSGSINQGSISSAVRPPSLTSPSPLKSFNASSAPSAAPLPLTSMPGIQPSIHTHNDLINQAQRPTMLTMQPQGLGAPAGLSSLGPRPLSGPSVAPIPSNASYLPSQHVFTPMAAYNPSVGMPSNALPPSSHPSLGTAPSLTGARPMPMQAPTMGMPTGGLAGLAGFAKQGGPSQFMPGALSSQMPGSMPSLAPGTMPTLAPGYGLGAKPAALTSAPAPLGSLPLNKPSLSTPPPARKE